MFVYNYTSEAYKIPKVIKLTETCNFKGAFITTNIFFLLFFHKKIKLFEKVCETHSSSRKI